MRYVYTLVAYVRKDDPDATPIRAAAPANLLRGSELGDSIVAQTVYNKYALHLPLYRQLKELGRMGIEGVEEHTLCHWIRRAAEELAPLYKIENELRESNAPPEEVLRRRQEKSKPIVATFFTRLHARMTDTAKPPLNKLREALQYALNRKEELCTYLDDPAVPMDNNAIERAMRPIAIGRKNYLFMGSAEGGKRAAILYTLLRECERVGVDALVWLNAVLGKVSTWQGDLRELLPGNLQIPATH